MATVEADSGGASMGDLFSVEGKTAVVTGGSRGIGLMIARGFVEGGARVYVSSRKVAVCEEVARELSRVGECVALPADLSSEAACVALAAAVGEREGRVHVLVNNAGATCLFGQQGGPAPSDQGAG
jgi:NAD(P)-dependent dehydrogenase (short-subunit alcohol dehydrogenase family)